MLLFEQSKLVKFQYVDGYIFKKCIDIQLIDTIPSRILPITSLRNSLVMKWFQVFMFFFGFRIALMYFFKSFELNRIALVYPKLFRVFFFHMFKHSHKNSPPMAM